MEPGRLRRLMTRCDFEGPERAIAVIRELLADPGDNGLIRSIEPHIKVCDFDALGQPDWNWEIIVIWEAPPGPHAVGPMTGWLRTLMDVPADQVLWVSAADARAWTFLVPYDGRPREYAYAARRFARDRQATRFSKWELRFTYRVMRFLSLLTKEDLPPCPSPPPPTTPPPGSVFTASPFLGVPRPPGA